MIYRSFSDTVAGLGADGKGYRRIVEPVLRHWDHLVPQLLGPMISIPRHPVALARFGIPALVPSTTLSKTMFNEERAKALLAGRAHVESEDLRALTHSTFRHRVLVNYRAEAEGVGVEEIIQRLLETVPRPAE